MKVLAAVLALALQDPTPVDPAANEVEDVVVIGRATPPAPFDVFQAVCLDANRLDGRAFRPVDVPRWTPLPSSAFSPLGAGSDVFVRRDGDLEMVLAIREGPDLTVDRVSRHECSLTLVGPHDQRLLESGMFKAMKGGGTQRHLQLKSLFQTYPGWTQLAWTAIPHRNTSRWDAGTGFVVVTHPSFYRTARYVVTELRYTGTGDQLVSHMVLTYLKRTEP